ncbi:hypothetical protein BKA61DRAFT_738014 [Leptodontidium sp. MPI-SDFR-AT-0119]|nr:hypothetical protein BKA61DRAFT_738014 [Leptodontidium sp. MPI-SDFR-AT-0119]
MDSPTRNTKQRHYCDHEGCNKSYIRVEHLNRHRLTHQERAFACYICKKPFTRNDLLQAHLRRHDEPSFVTVDTQQETTPPSEEPLVEPRKRTKPGWDSSARPFAPPGEIDFGSVPIQQPRSVSGITISHPNVRSEPAGFPLERVIFGAPAGDPSLLQEEMQVDPKLQVLEHDIDSLDARLAISDDCYQSLLVELPVSSTISIPMLACTITVKSDLLKLVVQELTTLLTGDKSSLQKLFFAGFDYLESVMPLFHRPTFDVSSELKLVILAVCSLGGILNLSADARDLGLIVYNHIRGGFYPAARDGEYDWLIAHVPAVLIIEHISYYGLAYQDHGLANVTHGMMIAVYTQSSFLSQKPCNLDSRIGTLDELWKYWIATESNIRHAYSIFTADIKSSIHFMRPPLLSRNILDLPLPCLSRIWQATTAVEWENEMVRYKSSSKHSAPLKLRSLMEIFLGHSHPGPEYNNYFEDPVILDILIHAIGSEILDLGHAAPSASSKAIDLLRRSDLVNGLARWKSYFDQLDLETRETDIAVSIQVTYHLASIFLQEEVSALIAGFECSGFEGRTLCIPSNENDDGSGKRGQVKVGKDACVHAVNITNLYLRKRSPNKTRSFYENRTAVIACLVLTTYMANLKQPLVSEGNQMSKPGITDRNTAQLLDFLDERASQTSIANSRHFEAAIATATELVKAIRDQVSLDPGEISQNSCNRIDDLLRKLS